MKNMRRVIFAYERHHVPEILAYVKRYPDTLVACLNFWAERALRHKGVSCVPLTAFQPHVNDEEDWWTMTQNISREWYRLPGMTFFSHRGVSLGEALEPILEMYLSKLLYYVRIFLSFKVRHPDCIVHLPIPKVAESAAGPLASFEHWAVVDAALMAGLSLGETTERTIASPLLFPRPVWKSLLLVLYNVLLSLIVKRKRRKFYASEYWSHIAPLLPYLPDTEIVLMESSELAHASWWDILSYRIRVRHPADERSAREIALISSRDYNDAWDGARPHVYELLSKKRKDLDWNPILRACDRLIAYAPRVIADLEGFQRILEAEHPSVIIERASVGGRQHHFFLLANIARQLHIPSVELQHAGAVFDPRSPHSRLETDYLAAYGDVEKEQYAKNGYSEGRIVPVGSPRLDAYRASYTKAEERARTLGSLGLDHTRPVVLVSVPAEQAGLYALNSSSYDLAAFFEEVGKAALAVPTAQFLFKFRDNPKQDEREYLHELFPKGGVAIATGDPRPLMVASNIVTSGNSTMMYEAMLSERPLILYPWKAWDYHLPIYREAAPYVSAGEDLGRLLSTMLRDHAVENRMLARIHTFLQRHAFDGRAAKRTAEFLKSLT